MSTWESLPWSKQVEALFHRYAEKVYRCALRGLDGDIQQANDVVQQVFLAVCKQYESDLHQLTDRRQEALILRIAHRRIVDYWREVSREREARDEWSTLERTRLNGAEDLHADAEHSDRIEENDQLRRFWDVLTRDLTRMEYRVALMTWEMELSTEMISRDLNTSVPAVMTHRSRARGKIREALKQYRGWEEGGVEL